MKRFLPFFFMIFLLVGCAETQFLTHMIKQIPHSNTTIYKVGSSYTIDGKRYYPRESFTYSETGIASWYGPDFHGKDTANGETYNKYDLTAAHRTLQMPSIVRVTNLENGRSIKLRINDRGPFAKGRIIDLSKRGAELLKFKNQGTARVKVEVLDLESRIVKEAAQRGQKLNVQQSVEIANRRRQNAIPSVQIANDQAQPDIYQVAQQGTGLNGSLSAPSAPVMTGDPVSLIDPNTLDNVANQAEPFQNMTATQKVEIERIAAPDDGSMQRLDTIDPASFDDLTPDPVTINSDLQYTEKDVEIVPVEQNTGLYIQAGAFTNHANAQALTSTLMKAYEGVKLSTAIIDGKQFYRVRIGPIDAISRADEILNRIWNENDAKNARIVVE